MSAIPALVIALDAAVTNDDALQELGCVWYLLQAPATANPPYIVADFLNETNRNRFRRRGGLELVTLNIWGADGMVVANLYKLLHACLHLQPLTIEGQILDRADLTLLSVLQNPDGTAHGIAEYRAQTKVAAVETSP